MAAAENMSKTTESQVQAMIDASIARLAMRDWLGLWRWRKNPDPFRWIDHLVMRPEFDRAIAGLHEEIAGLREDMTAINGKLDRLLNGQ